MAVSCGFGSPCVKIGQPACRCAGQRAGIVGCIAAGFRAGSAVGALPGEDRLSTPRDDGFAMAPDWAPHARCWMAWPCREAPWGGGLDAARRAYAEVAQAIARFEPVTMIARPELVAMASLYCGPGITILPMAHDDSWVRDIGPSFVAGAAGELARRSLGLQRLGRGYPDYAQDRRWRSGSSSMSAPAACRRPGARGRRDPGRRRGDLPRGDRARCSTQAQSRARPRRGRGRAACASSACDAVIWLPAGLIDDEAGGHVENVACSPGPAWCWRWRRTTRRTPTSTGLAANLEVLRARQSMPGAGRSRCVTVPQPKARPRHDGRRLTLSHLSCYLANGAVIVPSFGDACRQAGRQGIGRRLARARARADRRAGAGRRAAAGSTASRWASRRRELDAHAEIELSDERRRPPTPQSCGAGWSSTIDPSWASPTDRRFGLMAR